MDISTFGYFQGISDVFMNYGAGLHNPTDAAAIQTRADTLLRLAASATGSPFLCL
jgi:hypothetical protein